MITELQPSEFSWILSSLGFTVGQEEIKLLKLAIAMKIQMIIRDVECYFPQWGTHTGRYSRYFAKSCESEGRVLMGLRPCFVRKEESEFEVIFPASAILETIQCSGLISLNNA
jgi:hypothetical protein